MLETQADSFSDKIQFHVAQFTVAEAEVGPISLILNFYSADQIM